MAATTTAAAATPADRAEVRLADHFPRVDKSCKKPATKFFDCFSEKGNQPPEGVSVRSALIRLCISVPRIQHHRNRCHRASTASATTTYTAGTLGVYWFGNNVSLEQLSCRLLYMVERQLGLCLPLVPQMRSTSYDVMGTSLYLEQQQWVFATRTRHMAAAVVCCTAAGRGDAPLCRTAVVQLESGTTF